MYNVNINDKPQFMLHINANENRRGNREWTMQGEGEWIYGQCRGGGNIRTSLTTNKNKR